jgi:hypothetical protein
MPPSSTTIAKPAACRLAVDPVSNDPAEKLEHHCVYCPTCSSRLQDSRCKLVCKVCGYFLSCADFY